MKLFSDIQKQDPTGGGFSPAYSIIQRVPLKEGSEIDPDPNGKVLSLLNLLCAPATSPLKDLAKALTRLESLSHILVWTEKPVLNGVEENTVNLVELPRMNLTFYPEESGGKTRLVSAEHSGWYLSAEQDKALQKLFSGIPQASSLHTAFCATLHARCSQVSSSITASL